MSNFPPKLCNIPFLFLISVDLVLFRNIFLQKCYLKSNSEATVSLHYTSPRCPKDENWYYDSGSDVCYYFDSNKNLPWNSAYRHCKYEVGGSLAYFTSFEEYESFLKLMQILQISCKHAIWLGYFCKNGFYKTLNDSIAVNITNSQFPYGYVPYRCNKESYIRYLYNPYRSHSHAAKWLLNGDQFSIDKFVCQCKPGNCTAQSSSINVVSGETKSDYSNPSLNISSGFCPQTWTHEKNYTNICYKYILEFFTWPDSVSECNKLHQNATLPIFRNLQEYISYGNWWNEHVTSDCHKQSWLGLKFDASVNNFTWVDGSNVTFFNVDRDENPNENLHIYHEISGSKWSYSYNQHIDEAITICQLRLEKSLYLSSSTNFLRYPTSSKCPNRPNWFYDTVSNICYYYYHHRNHFNSTLYQSNRVLWTSASNYCKTNAGGNLPYFLTRIEYESQILHISCMDNIHLGYTFENGTYRTENGYSEAFFQNIFPKNHETLQNKMDKHIYFSWSYKSHWRAGGYENFEAKFLCQCRPGNCKN